jgi:hypothetical protein
VAFVGDADDQDALPFIGANVEVDAIGPDIDVALLSQRPLLILVFIAPLRFQPTNGSRRHPFGLMP